MDKEIIRKAEEEMKSVLNFTIKELSSLRAGRATPALLDGVLVNAYNSRLPVNQLATVTTPQPNLISIQPWDKNITGEISKAILASNLGLNPVVDASGIRLPIPPLSEERRREVVKVAHKISEQGKVEIREARRKANEALRKAEKDKTASEDQMHLGIDQVQKLTDRNIAEVERLLREKETEIMETG